MERESMIDLASKRLYRIGESYRIFLEGMRTIRYLSRAKKDKKLSPEFIERIMMAVTEVNGCDICSYAHTKMALEIGMSDVEIKNLLSGVIDDIPDDEIEGVIFAQHYADERGRPSEKSWEKILDIYGFNKAMGILGAIRIIMVGNVFGIPSSSFFKRFKGKSDKRSTLIYELSMILSFVILIPIAVFHALVFNLMRKPIISFAK
jgi:AhpD family alkylhydroperoxidase